MQFQMSSKTHSYLKVILVGYCSSKYLKSMVMRLSLVGHCSSKCSPKFTVNWRWSKDICRFRVTKEI